jgi:hypothetical protein
MKPARVKAAVVAVTAVEGADVRAEDEAVTGVEVVAEDPTNNFLIIAVVLAFAGRTNASTEDSGGFALR